MTTTGEQVAGIYSLIATAKLNDLDCEAYLRYVLVDRIAPVVARLIGGRS